MSKLDEYRKFQGEMQYAAHWAAMLGKRYHGGGGGIGKLTRVIVKPELYFQHSDGATNYHEAPEGLCRFLAAEITKDFPRLLANAQAAMDAQKAEMAAAATEEHAKLMKDAGLLTEAVS